MIRAEFRSCWNRRAAKWSHFCCDYAVIVVVVIVVIVVVVVVITIIIVIIRCTEYKLL